MKRAIWFCLLLASGGPSEAASLAVLSYDEPNGYGQAHNGTLNYWDANYTGSGNKTVDGAPLTGGLGALTDGVITNQNWPAVENASGTGPYVGWITIDPTITFHLAGVRSYQTIDVYVDNSGTGGVSAPSAIVVSDGVHSQSFAVTNPGFGSPLDITLNVAALGLAGNTVSLTLDRSTDVAGFPWVFAQEVVFQGTTVDEPVSQVLLALGLGVVLFLGLRGAPRIHRAVGG
jgi:hypothetical protein